MTRAGSHLKLLYYNYGKGATWTASTEVATFPASNLALGTRFPPWRSTGVASQWIKVHYSAARAMAAWGVVDGNLTPSATVTFEANSTDSWTSPAVTIPFTPWDPGNSGVLVDFLSAVQTYEWARWMIDDPTNPDGCLEIGCVYPSPVFDLGRGPGPLPSFRPVDPSLVERGPAGALHAYKLPHYRELRIPLVGLDRSLIFPTLDDALELLGIAEPMILSLYGTAPSQDAIAIAGNRFGHFSELPFYDASLVTMWQGELAFAESV